MKASIAVCFFFITATAHALGLSYTNAHSSIGAVGIIDGYPQTSCYSDIIDPGAGSLVAFGGVATGDASSCSSDFGSTVDGTMSALTAEGFSMSGTVSSYFNSGINERDSVGSAFIRRDVYFTLTETTEVLLELDWSACDGCTYPSDNFYYSQAGVGFTLTGQTAGAIDSVDFYRPQSAGSFSNVYTLGPGNYRFNSGIGAGIGGLASAELTGSVSLSVVPLPGAVWLFASALAGLGWLRRNHVA